MILLYGEGLKAKVAEAEYAQQRIRAFTPEISETTTTTSLPVDIRLEFYVDAFFAFLYSAFDVLAQVINQAKPIGLLEGAVSFKAVETWFRDNDSDDTIGMRLAAIKKTRNFNNLDDYRNCSTHRRQIFIKSIQTEVKESGTGAYSISTTQVSTVTRTLCDNPLEQVPAVSGRRALPDYCDRIAKWAPKEIGTVIRRI